MSRNRISYNIEDVFVGSPPGETNVAITGVTGNGLSYQVLQRLNKIQSFDYSFDIPKEPVTVLGRTFSEFEERTAPASVNIDFSYLSDGTNNEERMGFSTQKQEGQYPESVSVPFVSGLMDKTADKRNIYLAIKGQGEGDIHEYSTGDYAFPPTGFAFCNVQDVASPTAGDQDYIVFQNCYYNRYDVTFGVGELATVNIGAVADNAIFQKGLTTGVGIPYINTQTAETGFSGVSLVVPKYINPNNTRITNMPQVIRPAHINVSITKDATEKPVVEFTDDSVQSCDISLDLSREPITYLGHKLYADRQLQTPIDFTVGFDYVVSGHQSGNMMDNFNETEKYNVNIDFITGNLLAMNYKASGLNLESVGTTSSIGSNKSSSVAFRGQFDLDEQKRGFFVSGSVISLGIITFASGRRGSAVIYPTDDAGNLLTDDRSEFLYPRY
jgi:hypothetical protein